jgi:RNA polymerase sigma-70 factor, ECF subfamily
MATKASVLPEANIGEPAGAHPAACMAGLQQALGDQRQALLIKARQLTRDHDEAQDLVQDAIVRGMAALDRFKPGTNLRAWLMRIMVNLFIDHCRHRAARPALVPVPDDLAEEHEPEAEPPPLSARVTIEQLQQALTQLDPLFREVYELRIKKNRSYEQIASELHIPVATVGSRLLRARERLCRLLTPQVEQADS